MGDERSITTIVIGAGHAGLAMSRRLDERAIDHVVLERGEVANTWRTERWDSLRLLTPNWLSRLPGFGYDGADPDGYRTVPEVVDFLDRYARAISAPVHTHTRVISVRQREGGYVVTTDSGVWRCRSVVLASGACNAPRTPDCASGAPPRVASLHAMHYRRPSQLSDGGVLIVGASATGVQLAHEIQLSGRPVTLAVGEHVRAPRVYRGKDILWWMDATGLHDERFDQVDDLGRARRLPSFQLVGTPERKTIDLNALADSGVRIVGRIAGILHGKAQFSGALHNLCALADLKMNRLLGAFDAWARQKGLDDQLEAPHRLPPTHVASAPLLQLDLATREIETIIWATGYRPDYSWLHAPVVDAKGQLRHTGGVVDCPGLYVLGLQFLRRRKSALIDGAGDDARELCDHLAGYLGGSPA